ncbi:hypothetical protein, partial [Legionella micdadei]
MVDSKGGGDKKQKDPAPNPGAGAQKGPAPNQAQVKDAQPQKAKKESPKPKPQQQQQQQKKSEHAASENDDWAVSQYKSFMRMHEAVKDMDNIFYTAGKMAFQKIKEKISGKDEKEEPEQKKGHDRKAIPKSDNTDDAFKSPDPQTLNLGSTKKEPKMSSGKMETMGSQEQTEESQESSDNE